MWNHALRTEFDRAISKRICRDRQDRFYLLTNLVDSQKEGPLGLCVARTANPSSLEDFYPPIPVRGREPAFAAGMAVDRQNGLHMAGSTRSGSSWYMVADLKAFRGFGRPGPIRWFNPHTMRTGVFVVSQRNSWIGDITVAPNGRIWITWTVRCPNHASSIYMGSFSGRRWRAFRLAEGYGFFPGTLLVDEDDHFHLTWHDVYQDIRHVGGKIAELGSRKKWRNWMFMDWAHRGAIAKVGSRALVAYEDYGSVMRSLFPEEGKQNCPHDVNFNAPRVFGDDPRLAWDTCHSQQFAIDRHGVPWLFFIDSSREHLFYVRRLGAQWGPLCNGICLRKNSPRMETNHLAIDRLAVEERTPLQAAGIGFSIANESSSPRTEFHQVAVPSLEFRPGKKVLFFDLQEIKAMENLELKLNAVRKFKKNPVIAAGGPNDFDAHGAGGFMTVLKENGIYRMWYSGIFLDANVHWPYWGHIGYAESRDGYKFKKIKLGQVTFRGNRNTNIIKGPSFVPSVCFDPYDSDSRRRYKVLKFPPPILNHDEARAGRMVPWNDRLPGTLFTSADGIRWKPEKAEIRCPAGKPLEIIPQSLFYDPREKDPNKKYKAYGFSSLNLGRRGGSYIYSPDCVNWTACPQNPVLDALARCIPPVRGGKVHQIHDTVVWQYGDYYLAFYHYQYNGGKLDIELAMSRDGENFVFVKPGEKVISLGEPGNWDADLIAPGEPLVDGNEIRIYYGGLTEHHWKGNTTGVDYDRSGGLGTLRLDGFTHLQLKEGERSGSLTTIPVDRSGPADRLVVNAECGKDAFLEVELIDAATGRTIPGYSRAECNRISGNSLAHAVSWRQHGDSMGAACKRFQLKFYFSGSAGRPRLYSFEFI